MQIIIPLLFVGVSCHRCRKYLLSDINYVGISCSWPTHLIKFTLNFQEELPAMQNAMYPKRVTSPLQTATDRPRPHPHAPTSAHKSCWVSKRVQQRARILISYGANANLLFCCGMLAKFLRRKLELKSTFMFITIANVNKCRDYWQSVENCYSF